MKIKAYYAMVMLYWFSAYAYVPTFTPYLKGIGISYSMIGLIGSAYGVTQMLIRIPLGIASDRLRRRRMFINLGMLVGTMSSIGLFFTENELLIFLMRALSGAASSTWVIITVLFSSYFTQEKAASRTSHLMMANSFGQVAAMLLGATLAGYAGYKAPFLLSAAAVAAALIISLFVEETAPPDTKTPPTIKEIFRVGKNHRLLIMSILTTLIQIVLSGATHIFLPEIALNLGGTTGLLGYLSSIVTIPRIIASLVCGVLLSKAVDERKLLAGAFLLTSITAALTPFSPNLPFLFIVNFFSGFGIGMVITLCLSLCTSGIDDSLKSTGMGFYQAIYGIGMTAGPAMIGVVVDHFGLAAGFIFAAGVALIGLIVTLIFLASPAAPRNA